MEAEPGALTVPFELTHVRYAPGDVVGYALALVSLMPLAVTVALATLVAVRRDVRTITFFQGMRAAGGCSQTRAWAKALWALTVCDKVHAREEGVGLMDADRGREHSS
jgi:hypothetical protein